MSLAHRLPFLRCFGVALAFWSVAAALHASTGLPEAKPPAMATADDCFSIGNASRREACFARMDESQIGSCERYRPLACKPYKEMFAAAKTLDGLVSEMIEASGKKFSSYAGGSPAYPTNVADGIRAAERAWQAYRDTHCQLEPLLEGMSQNAAGDLAEKCRLDLTHQRIKQIREWVARLQAKD